MLFGSRSPIPRRETWGQAVSPRSLSLSLASQAAGQSSGLPFGLIVSEQARTSFTLVGAGARAAGMGGAFTALADDATAASFNPAGLAQLLVPEASAVVDFSRHRDEYRNFRSYDQVPVLGLTDSTVEFDESAFNFASVTVPFELFSRRFAVQLSTQRLVDFTYDGTRAGSSRWTPRGAPFYRLEPVERPERLDPALLGVARLPADGTDPRGRHRQPVGRPLGDGQHEHRAVRSSRKRAGDVHLLPDEPPDRLERRPRAPAPLPGSSTSASGIGLPSTPTTTSPLPSRRTWRHRSDPLPATTTTLHWPGTLNVGLAIKPADTLVLAADWGRTDWSKMVFDAPGVRTRQLLRPRAARDDERGDERRLARRGGVPPLPRESPSCPSGPAGSASPSPDGTR